MNKFVEASELEFRGLAELLFAKLEAGEELALNYFAEDSAFVRINGAKVRQNTHVWQKGVEAEFHSKGKTVKFSFPVTGQTKEDHEFGLGQLEIARAESQHLPADPFQVPFENRGTSREVFDGKLLPLAELPAKVAALSSDNDLAGLYSGGPIVIANANSKGQSHFFATENYTMDYSLFDGPRAVKGLVAGSHWDEAKFSASVRNDAERLKLLKFPVQDVKKGSYRVYLAPAATLQLVGIMSWGALSQGAYKRGQNPLQKLIDGKVSNLSPLFSLEENFALGGSPRFNSLGEVSETHLPLITKGKVANLLCSSRTAKEFGVPSNQAETSEGMRSPDMAAGDLEEKDILQRLGTGLYLSNLHYLNWSDRVGARITGMTRYACFWVEKGEIVGPIKDLRFDESLFRIFGSELEAVTRERELSPETSNYERRQAGVSRVPGILLKDFTFTL
jgi:predicted Zn-dependent protease